MLFVDLRAIHVALSAHAHSFDILWRQLADHLGGGADGKRVVRYFLTFAHQRLSADQAVFADLGAVQDHRIDTDQ